MNKLVLLVLTSALASGAVPAAVAATPLVDQIMFGNSQSEAAHQLQGGQANSMTGALGQSARQLPPLAAGDWKSANLSFHLTVDPHGQNYASVRLWGGDINHNKLALSCAGRQIGYRHLGDIEILDLGTEAPTYAGRFSYKTFPLPLSLTKGKSKLDCTIRAMGPFAVYNQEFSKFQKPMDGPSRPIYALYVHTEPFLQTAETEGQAPGNPPLRPTPGPEVMDQVKARINGEIDKLLASARPLSQEEMQFLARAYDMAWSRAYHKRAVVNKVIEGADALYLKYLADARFITSDGATWIALGPFGKSLKILEADIQPELDRALAGRDGKPVSRRQAYEAMLAHGLDFMVQHRRLYTNQSMIVDLMGIHYSNDGLLALKSSKARGEAEVRKFLYESVGLLPWSGSLDDKGKPTYSSSASDTGAFRLPDNHHIFSASGLSRELGYVGNYGEIQDLAASIYLATVPKAGAPGDPQLLEQLIKIARTRQFFRYPIIDADGYRSMALEAYIGWRDPKYPGVTTYVQRMGWDNTPLFIAMVTRDPQLMAAAQQMLADNQYYAILRERMQNTGQRVTFGLLDAYDEWTAVMNWPRQPLQMPMTPGQADFVFADPVTGTIALKHGDEILYASLYWRANCGVNKLSRIHYMTPRIERVATVYGRVDFVPSGKVCTRGSTPHYSAGAIPNVVYPDDLPPALAGEELPIAKMPAGSRFGAAKDNPYAGRGDYYETRYGSYLMAMNASADKPVELRLPQGRGALTELVSRSAIPAGSKSLVVKPGQTVVVHMAN